MLLPSVCVTIAVIASRVNGQLDLSSSNLWSDTDDPLTLDGVDFAPFDQLDSSLLGEKGDVSLFAEEPGNDPLLWGDTVEPLSGADVDLASLNDDPTSYLSSGTTSSDLFALDSCSSNSRVRRRDSDLCRPIITKPDTDKPPDTSQVENPLDTIKQSPIFRPFLEGEDVCRKYLGGILPLAICDSGRYPDTTRSTFRDISDGQAFPGSTNPSDFSQTIQGLSEFQDIFDSGRFRNLKSCQPGMYPPFANTVLLFVRSVRVWKTEFSTLALPVPPYCYHPTSLYCCAFFYTVTPQNPLDTGTRASPCMPMLYLRDKFPNWSACWTKILRKSSLGLSLGWLWRL